MASSAAIPVLHAVQPQTHAWPFPEAWLPERLVHTGTQRACDGAAETTPTSSIRNHIIPSAMLRVLVQSIVE